MNIDELRSAALAHHPCGCPQWRPSSCGQAIVENEVRRRSVDTTPDCFSLQKEELQRGAGGALAPDALTALFVEHDIDAVVVAGNQLTGGHVINGLLESGPVVAMVELVGDILPAGSHHYVLVTQVGEKIQIFDPGFEDNGDGTFQSACMIVDSPTAAALVAESPSVIHLVGS